MPATVLIVDDDPATLAGLVSLVEGAGYSAVGAADFIEGRRALLQRRPDLIIVDVRLGEYNGLQLAVVARAMSPPVPAIVSSGFEDPVLQQEARNLGAPFLVKPIDPASLLVMIEKRLPNRPTAQGVASAPRSDKLTAR